MLAIDTLSHVSYMAGLLQETQGHFWTAVICLGRHCVVGGQWQCFLESLRWASPLGPCGHVTPPIEHAIPVEHKCATLWLCALLQILGWRLQLLSYAPSDLYVRSGDVNGFASFAAQST